MSKQSGTFACTEAITYGASGESLSAILCSHIKTAIKQPKRYTSLTSNKNEAIRTVIKEREWMTSVGFKARRGKLWDTRVAVTAGRLEQTFSKADFFIVGTSYPIFNPFMFSCTVLSAIGANFVKTKMSYFSQMYVNNYYFYTCKTKFFLNNEIYG